MGKNIDSYIKEQFEISPVDVKTYSPLTLAYGRWGVRPDYPVCCGGKRKYKGKPAASKDQSDCKGPQSGGAD